MTTGPDTPSRPGWHGKLPALGDFASRRLDPDFVATWDGWLAAGLHALRRAEPDRWLDAYLASPSWRFLLQPGALDGAAGRHAWAGVLMPSVDRVGRYFPFTLAQPLPALPAAPAARLRLWQWLARLDALAGDALHDDWPIERLEEALAAVGALPGGPAAAGRPALPAPGAIVEWPLDGADGDPAAALDDLAHAHWNAAARGLCCWSTCPQEQAPRLLLSHGLPAAAAIGALLGS